MSPTSASIDVAGVAITHPDRVLFPEPDDPTRGVTKVDLARYMVRVAPKLLPHVAERPLSLVRCPQGQSGACFYQKHWTTTPPPGVTPVEVEEESGTRAPYLVVDDVHGLVSLVQYGVLELHPWGARADAIDAPDRAIFDLDPAPDVPWSRVVRTAQRTRTLLNACGLDSWVKLTGGKGVHVVVPFAPSMAWSDLHDFARLVTARLMADDPDGLIDRASKAARAGRIFVDYLRNARGATAVAPWSPRARVGAPVAVPISWSQLGMLTGADVAHVATISDWMAAHRRDPWTTLVRSSQTITEAVMAALMSPRPTRPRSRRADPVHPRPSGPDRPATRRKR